MDGLTLNRVRAEAFHFAEALLDESHHRSFRWRSAPLGPASFRLGLDPSVELGRFIDGAFLEADPHEAEPWLAVLHQEHVRLPHVNWARPWIKTRIELPPEIAHPYRIFFDSVVGVVHVLDNRDGRSAVWIRHASELDPRSFITPFRIMLSWIGNLMDLEIIHASAVFVDDCGVTFSGPSGSGKSTLAIALGLDTGQIIADDCLVADHSNVYAVYARAKVDNDSRLLLGIDNDRLVTVSSSPRAKRILHLESLGESFRRSAPLDLWMNPTRSRISDVYPIPARRMHNILTTDSLREILGGTHANRARLARLAWRVPSFRLLLSPIMADNKDTVRRAIGMLSSSTRGIDDVSSA
jgi:hypothetical protein